MNRIRNLFFPVSVCCVGLIAGATFFISGSGAAGVLTGGLASSLLTVSRIRGIDLAHGSTSGIKWSSFFWGITRWFVYAAVFYIVVRYGTAPVASVVGAAGGLLIPLAVLVLLAMTDRASEETAD